MPNAIGNLNANEKGRDMKKKNHSEDMHIYSEEQDSGIVFRCCSLGSPFKILPCEFFSWNESVFFN